MKAAPQLPSGRRRVRAAVPSVRAPGISRKRQHPEQKIQQAIAQLFTLCLPPDKVVFTAIGHGGGGAVRGAFLKSMGLLPGVADLMVSWTYQFNCRTTPPYVVVTMPRIVWFEVKDLKKYQSQPQKDFEGRVTSINHLYYVIHSMEGAYDILTALDCPVKRVQFFRYGGYRLA